ncbi:hypothetical protein A2964_03285 [Candidatus Daviesbacteria bacterium RIFCSPLOWO2_01_FULL_40_27]|nr:MAG: hypothetical protein A2964_03285 [Candidatus Daviesbacteria bacterium RIFCSPLOWO2_01_FULL_40_27]
MDNQNDPNSTNNPTYPPAGSPPGLGGSTPSPGAPNQPFPDLGNFPQSTTTPTQSEPTSIQSEQTSPPPLTNSDPIPSNWPPPSDPTPPTAQPPSSSSPSPTWPPPPMSQGENPPYSTIPPQDQAPAWTPPAQTTPQFQPQPTSEPTPTFTPPPPTVAPSDTEPTGQTSEAGGSQPALSPLDNPWGAPVQTPPIEQPQPATQPSWTNIPTNPAEDQATNVPPATPSEATPTDLSHLISNNQPEQTTPPASETMDVPSVATPTPEVPTLPTENHKGIPKWLIGLGIGLLVLVGGASAYFILGIGQPNKTTSLPATTVPETTEVKTPLPITTPVAQPSPEQSAATGSANFGELGGSSGNQGATSAAELLRQRQQGR